MRCLRLLSWPLILLLATGGSAAAEPRSSKRPKRPTPSEPAPAPAAAPAPEPEPAPPPTKASASTSPARRPAPSRAAAVTEEREAPSGPPARGTALGPTRFIQLAVGLHFDDGTMHGTDRRSILVTDETFDFSAESKLYGSLGLLLPFGERLHAGMALRYFGSYEIKRKGDNGQKSTLGTMGELVAQGQYTIAMMPKADLLVGAEAGLALLVPGGDFEQEIEGLRKQGAGVWNVPRLGYLLGPQLGARYRIADRVFVRADLAVTWCQTFLFFTNDDVEGVDFEKKRRANVIRTRFAAGIEVAF